MIGDVPKPPHLHALSLASAKHLVGQGHIPKRVGARIARKATRQMKAAAELKSIFGSIAPNDALAAPAVAEPELGET